MTATARKAVEPNCSPAIGSRAVAEVFRLAAEDFRKAAKDFRKVADNSRSAAEECRTGICLLYYIFHFLRWKNVSTVYSKKMFS
jgi:hypothetical protein